MAELGPRPLILASGSRARRRMMEDAGLAFDVVLPTIDEKAASAAMHAQGAEPLPPAVAEYLARAKAEDVSQRMPSAVVIGGDQVLNLGRQLLAKAADQPAARATLTQLRGRTHELHSAVAIARGGETIWSMVDTARLTMRSFTDAFMEHYLAREGDGILEAVGAFRLEGLGAQLFECIEGDYFTILGLPLLPLLAQLRTRELLMK